MTYEDYFSMIERKLLDDMRQGKFDIDEFRRITRGLAVIAGYLDQKAGR